MGRKLQRLLILASLALIAATIAPAYYHFVHYRSFGPPFAPVYEKFDLQALVDNTVRYYISSVGPESLAPNDSADAITSQIRAAAAAWDGVGTSDLRIAFGGIASPETVQDRPGIDIVFDEIPPGLIAMGGPTSRAEVVSRDGREFVPITRAVVVLNKDLSRQPSSSDGFFMTLVHELGHALGLQHTFTSSVMSTGITRATTKASPLGPDDVAAISLLYPGPGFAESTGAISGRVVLDDNGVNLASVVALSPQGTAVSTLANPDGTYRIEGLPVDQYFVYVHPLPPPVYGEVSRANIVMPRDPDGEPIVANDYFRAQFFPGVSKIESATTVAVESGQTAENIDFYVARRGAPAVHSVTTYSFPGNLAVPSGYVSLASKRRFLVAYGIGLAAGGGPAPGLETSVIGGSAAIPDGGLHAYSPDPRFVQIDFQFNPFSGVGSRHLLFSLDNDLYVLPSGLQLSQSDPPTVDGVTTTVDEEGRPISIVAGQRLTEATRILFDGAEARVLGSTAEGHLLVQPPPAPSGHRATVVALNPDGQSSWFLDGLEPRTFDYEETDFRGFTMQPSVLPAGSEAMVTIQGTNTHFESGESVVGLGSSDVVVRDYIVLDPTLIVANVAVAPTVTHLTIAATVATGLEMVNQPLSFRTTPADASQPSLHSPAHDVATGWPIILAGKPARLRVSSLPAGITPAELELTLNDQAAPIQAVDGDQVTFLAPVDVRPGPVVARLKVTGVEVRPVLLRFDLGPPSILGVFTENGDPVSAETPVFPSELLQLQVGEVVSAEPEIEPEDMRVTVNGIEHDVYRIIPAGDQPGILLVQFFLGTAVQAGAEVPLTVSYKGRTSAPVLLTVTAE